MNDTNASAGHAFVSYVREDADRIRPIIEALQAAEVPSWTDKTRLSPGEEWELVIRKAIQRNALAFIAVFSDNSAARSKSYQNEELFQAVEQFRRRPPGRPWIIPVRLDDCELPDFDLGGGRTLDSLQRVDLFGPDREPEMVRLVTAVLRILGESTADPAAVQATISLAKQEERGANLAHALKAMLPDPKRQIELEELMLSEARHAKDAISDEASFPNQDQIYTNADGARWVVQRFNDYKRAVEPLATGLATACAWSSQDQESMLTRSIRAIATLADGPQSGSTFLIAMKDYPLQLAVYAGAVGAVARGNFGALRAVAIDPIVRESSYRDPVISHISPHGYLGNFPAAGTLLANDAEGNEVSDEQIQGWFEKGGLRKTPMSDHFLAVIRPMVRDLFPDDDDYLDSFDETEVFLGALAQDTYLHFQSTQKRYVGYPFFGRFSWRGRRGDAEHQVHRRLERDLKSAGENWRPLRAGLFGGSYERAVHAFDTYSRDADSVLNRFF